MGTSLFICFARRAVARFDVWKSSAATGTGLSQRGYERPCGYRVHPSCYGYFHYIIVLGGPDRGMELTSGDD